MPFHLKGMKPQFLSNYMILRVAYRMQLGTRASWTKLDLRLIRTQSESETQYLIAIFPGKSMRILAFETRGNADKPMDIKVLILVQFGSSAAATTQNGQRTRIDFSDH